MLVSLTLQETLPCPTSEHSNNFKYDSLTWGLTPFRFENMWLFPPNLKDCIGTH